MPLNVVRYPKLCTRDAGADYLMHLPNWSPSPESNRETPGSEPGRYAHSRQTAVELVVPVRIELTSAVYRTIALPLSYWTSISVGTPARNRTLVVGFGGRCSATELLRCGAPGGRQSNAHFGVQSLASYRWTTGVMLERLEGFKPSSSTFAKLRSIR